MVKLFFFIFKFITETNNFNISKPIQGPSNQNSYVQIACDRLGKKEVHTTLTLVFGYTCRGTNHLDNMDVKYDA
jgi:hypothetical protein